MLSRGRSGCEAQQATLPEKTGRMPGKKKMVKNHLKINLQAPPNLGGVWGGRTNTLT